MSPGLVMNIGRETIYLAMMVLAPIFVMGFAVGITVSFAQAILQVQDPAVGMIPKMIAMAVSLLIFGSWMLTHLMNYFKTYLGDFSSFIQ
ncbi:MAG: flagellar biosynthetic protein FliQ [Deltaproteobacteria bacterium]|nr:flagellar biosynthetic protein FliQ [Deltaproteobacteria bacterium]